MTATPSPSPSSSSSFGPKWPAEAEADYEKVRPLGRGAFGTVWMAKSKSKKLSSSASEDSEGEEEQSAPAPAPEHDGKAPAPPTCAYTYVAIKSIRTSSKTEEEYAKRECDILSEMVHPNVLNLLRTYDPPSNKYKLCVLTLAHGPNVGELIKVGGALGLPVARLVSRHLVAAVGYLHGRGVVHRDIKPDNCVLVRAGGGGGGRPSSPATFDLRDTLDDDSVWSDDADGEDAVSSDKYKLILVDFGFAKALGPVDITKEASDDQMKEIERTAADLAKSSTSPSSASGGGRPSGRNSRQFKRGSVARVMVKGMSALGTRAFAAPEVKDGAHEKKSADDREALTETVADYGMVSDAFSVGVTLREVLTGVPASVEDIASYISARDNAAARALSSMCACGGNKKKGNNGDGEEVKKAPRKKKYRHVHMVPRTAASMIRDMTRGKSEERLTVREAQDHPWIAGDKEKGEGPYEIPRGDVPSRHGDPIVFLKCARGGSGSTASAMEGKVPGEMETLEEDP